MEHREKNKRYAKRLKPGLCCPRVPLLETSSVLGGLVASTLIFNTMVEHQSINMNSTAMPFVTVQYVSHSRELMSAAWRYANAASHLHG